MSIAREPSIAAAGFYRCVRRIARQISPIHSTTDVAITISTQSRSDSGPVGKTRPREDRMLGT